LAFFSQLKATYAVVKAIRANSGWSWDDDKGADITPEKKGTWDDYVAKHPAAHPFRNAGWVHLDEFDSLAPSSAKGSYVFRASQSLSTAVANEESSNTQGTAADEPNDVDGSQEQSAAESQVDIDWVRSSS
jgi:hypothetical protein